MTQCCLAKATVVQEDAYRKGRGCHRVNDFIAKDRCDLDLSGKDEGLREDGLDDEVVVAGP